MKALISDLVGSQNLVCGDAFCYLPSVCSNFTDKLEGFSLQVTFEGQADFLEIPLTGISWTNHTSKRCYVGINQVLTQNTTLVFGNMFFTQFMSVFTNSYTSETPGQTQQIWANLNSTQAPNITSAVYPQGANPFVQPSPTPQPSQNEWLWIVILSMICLILLLVICFVGYKCNQNREVSARES